MDLYQALKNRQEKLSLIGLGYVGMPIAVAFSKKVDVIGFDVNAEKVQLYQKGIDPTKEVGDEAIKRCSVDFTNNETKLREARFHIIAVPTTCPVGNNDIFIKGSVGGVAIVVDTVVEGHWFHLVFFHNSC